MVQGFDHVAFLRSLSFGGLLGAFIAGIIYLKFPYFQSLTVLPTAMVYGGLAGAGCQRAIESVVNFVIAPIGRFVSFYEKLIELELLLYFNKISPDHYQAIRAKLTEERFLGSSSNKLLPP